MANVTSRTANWRLFGGGGLALGGLLWALAWILAINKVPTVPSWIFVIAIIIIAVALAFVAFGETGSNGVVGKETLGKAALVIYAAGWLLIAINTAAGLGTVIVNIAGFLVIIGGLVSADAVYHRHVARGAARWILFVPAIIGTVYALGLWDRMLGSVIVLGLLVALGFLVTGVLYLVNDRKIG